jgi:F0F1-type ATP synthase assembly protein I
MNDPDSVHDKFSQRMAELRRELAEARELNDPILVANIEAQIVGLESGVAQFRENADALDEEFDRRLQELKARAATTQEVHQTRKREAEKRQAADAETTRGLGLGLVIAYSFIGFPMVGYFIGFLIERFGGPGYAKDWGAIIGMALGFISLFVLLRRANSS